MPVFRGFSCWASFIYKNIKDYFFRLYYFCIFVTVGRINHLTPHFNNYIMFKTLLTKLPPPHIVRLLLAILICMPVWGCYAKAQTVVPYAVFNEATGTLTFKCDDGRPSEAYSLNTDNASPLWISYHKETIKKVVFDASFAKARPTTCCNWFRNCENLREIEGIEF